MPAIDSISDTSSAVGEARETGFSAMTSDEFSKIIFAELGRQDPLAPSDTSTLIQQISGIRSIQSNLDLSGKLDALVSQNEFAGAATLLGKKATGLNASGDRVSGVVMSVVQSRDGAVLSLASGDRLAISAVETLEQVSPEVEEPS